MHSSQASEVDSKSDFDDGSDDFMNINKGPVKCTCPKCGMTHVLNFFWSGRGTPRKYCHRCREAVAAVSECVYDSVHESSRIRRGANMSINE